MSTDYYDPELDPYDPYGWNMVHQRVSRQLNEAAQTVMKTVEDMASKFE